MQDTTNTSNTNLNRLSILCAFGVCHITRNAPKNEVLEVTSVFEPHRVKLPDSGALPRRIDRYLHIRLDVSCITKIPQQEVTSPVPTLIRQASNPISILTPNASHFEFLRCKRTMYKPRTYCDRRDPYDKPL